MGVDPRSVKTVLAALDAAQVRYIVVGGLAVVAHGYIRETKDIDLVVELSPQNALAAVRALADLGYKPAVAAIALEDFADPAKRQSWIDEKNATVINLYSDAHPVGSVDLFISEPFDFERAYADSSLTEVVGETQTRIAALDDLITMKEVAGRPKDLVDLRQLEKIRDRERDPDAGPSR